MNALNTNLTGKYVVLKSRALKPEWNGLPFHCLGGFGCVPHTTGRVIGGTFADGEQTRINGLDVLKEITKKQFDEAAAACNAGTWKPTPLPV